MLDIYFYSKQIIEDKKKGKICKNVRDLQFQKNSSQASAIKSNICKLFKILLHINSH